MHDETLDLTIIKNARNSFAKALREIEARPDDEFVRDSVIQRFEFCYDFTAKFLRRHLKNIADNPADIETFTLQECVREGYKMDCLMSSWDVWHGYRENRNITSHTYDEAKATEVIKAVPAFLSEMDHFLEKLTTFYEA